MSQTIRKHIKSNIVNWLFKIGKVSLVAYLSYYILKLCTGVDFIDQFWQDHERLFLASYATIQVAVTFLFYEGLGKLLDLYISKWISRNEKEMQVSLTRKDQKEVKQFVHFCFTLLLNSKAFTKDELIQLETIPIDENKYHQKWLKTKATINNCLGIVFLSLLNLWCIGLANGLFITLLIILVVAVIICVFWFMVYYVLIKNLHLINVFIIGINASGRLTKQRAK